MFGSFLKALVFSSQALRFFQTSHRHYNPSSWDLLKDINQSVCSNCGISTLKWYHYQEFHSSYPHFYKTGFEVISRLYHQDLIQALIPQSHEFLKYYKSNPNNSNISSILAYSGLARSFIHTLIFAHSLKNMKWRLSVIFQLRSLCSGASKSKPFL